MSHAAPSSSAAGRSAAPADRHRPRSALALLAAGALASVLSGCATATPIGDLMDDPFRYDGQEVTVQGEVREAIGFLGPGIYRLEDGSGSLPVVSEEGGAPRSGASVRVRGTFRAAFTVAGRSLAVLVESRRENP